MVRVLAHDTIQKDAIDKALPLYEELIKITRTHKGLISYNLYQDVEKPEKMVFIEQWEDEDALKAHIADEAFGKVWDQIEALLDEDEVLEIMVDPEIKSEL